MFGLRFDFPELAIVILTAVVYFWFHSWFFAAIPLVIGFALIALYRN